MTEEKPPEIANDEKHIELVEFAVVLVAPSNDPSIINQDFLYRFNIVGPEFEVQQPTISTPVLSHISFTRGLSVVSVPDRVVFSQSGNPLGVAEVVSPGVAKRYVERVPHIAYTAVGINPKAFRHSTVTNPANMSNALHDHGAGISFQGVVPEVQIKTNYAYSDRTIVFEVGESEGQIDGNAVSGILFQANIHRDFTNVEPPVNTEILLDILHGWQNDLNDFRELAHQVNAKYLVAGSAK